MGKRFKHHNSWKKTILLVFLFVVLVLTLTLRPKFWNGRDKLVMVINLDKEGVVVSTLDPVSHGLTNIFIPASTQTQVADELGSWKLGSVWQLGLNEKMGGELLARTIAKNFSFPVFAWSDKLGYGLVNGRAVDLIRAVFSSYKTNIKIGDRIRIAIFSLGVGKGDREEIDLSKTSFLRKSRFLDGEEGYVVAREIPENIAAVFSEGILSEKNLKARIIDYTNTPKVADRVGSVIEVMGVKVAAVSKENVKDINCKVSGKEKILVRKMVLIFDCSDNSGADKSNFDLEIEIGKLFSF